MTRRRKFFLALVSLAVLVALAGAGAYWWLTSDRFNQWAKVRIINELRATYKVETEIDRLDVKLFSLTAEARGLRFRLPDEKDAFLIAERAYIVARADNLWEREFSLSRLDIEKPVLTVTMDEQGTVNLSKIVIPKRKRTPVEIEEDEKGPLVDKSIRSLKANVSEGKIILGGKTFPVDGRFDDFRLSVGTEGENTLLANLNLAKGTFSFAAGNGPRRTVTDAAVELNARVHKKDADIPTLIVTTPYGKTTVAGKVAWKRVNETVRVDYSGNLFTALDLAQTSRDFLPTVPLAGGAKFNARFSGTDEECRVEGNLDPLSMSLFGAAVRNLAVKYTVESSFNAFPRRLEGDIRATGITYNRVALNDFAAHVNVSEDFADIESFSARALGGGVKGRARVAYRAGTGERSSAEVKLDNIDLRSAAAAGNVPNRGLSGRFNADTDFAWIGTNFPNATGNAKVNFVGQVSGGEKASGTGDQGSGSDQGKGSGNGDQGPGSNPPEMASAEDQGSTQNPEPKTQSPKAALIPDPRPLIPLSGELVARLASGTATIQKLTTKIGKGTFDATGTYQWRTEVAKLDVNYATPDLSEAQDLAERLGVPLKVTLPEKSKGADGATLNKDVRIGLAGDGSFVGTISGRVGAPNVAGTVSISEIRVENNPVGKFSATFEASPTAVNFKEAALIQPEGGRLVASVATGLKTDQPTDLSLKLENVRLAPAGTILAAFPSARDTAQKLIETGGTVDGSLRVSDPRPLRKLTELFSLKTVKEFLSKLNGEGELKLRNAKSAYGEVETAVAKFTLRDGRAEIERAEAKLPAGTVTAKGGYTVDAGKYDVTVDAPNFDLSKLPQPASDTPLTGVVSLNLVSRSTLNNIFNDELEFTATVTSDAVNYGTYKFTRFSGKAVGDGKQAKLSLESRYLDQPYTATGTVDYKNEDGEPNYFLRSRFEFNKTALAPLFAVAGIGPQNLSGEVTGTANIEGPLYVEDPKTGKAAFTAGQVRLAADFPALRLVVPLGDVIGSTEDYVLVNDGPLKFTAGLDELNFNQFKLKDLRGETTSFTVAGRIARDAGNTKLTADGLIDLKLLRGFSRRLFSSGTATIKATVAGDIANPRLTGFADISDFNLRITDFPLILENGGGRVIFNSNRAQVETFEADNAGGGKVIVTGGAVFEELTNPRWRFGLKAENIRTMYPQDVRSLADGDLTLQGNRQVQVLSGTIKIKRAEYTKNTDLGTLLQTQLSVLPGASGSLQATSAQSTFTTLDIRVEAPETLFIRNNFADVAGSASLRLRGSIAQPDISGRILVTRGQLEFRNDRFQITRGVVTMPESRAEETFYDIQAESVIKGYRVIVGITGTNDNRRLVLRSEPSLPETSVISLLATGTLPPAGLTTPVVNQQVGVSAATTLLSELLTERIEEQTGRLFGINRFQIDPLLVGRGNDPTARLTVGRRITKDLSITFSTNLATAQEQVILIEYRLRNDLSVIGIRDQRGNFGFDVRFTKRF
jgi:translocation and assembly module TamB